MVHVCPCPALLHDHLISPLLCCVVATRTDGCLLILYLVSVDLISAISFCNIQRGPVHPITNHKHAQTPARTVAATSTHRSAQHPVLYLSTVKWAASP